MGAITRPFLKSERLTLRPLVRGDAAAIARLASDPLVAWMTERIPHPYGLADAQKFLAAVLHDPPRPVFGIEAGDLGLAGVIGLDSAADGLNLGYWLGRDFRGRGFATEAARMALAFASGSLGRRAVFAGHFADNPASGGVLVKAGFLYTGEVRTLFSVGRNAAVACRQMVWLA